MTAREFRNPNFKFRLAVVRRFSFLFLLALAAPACNQTHRQRPHFQRLSESDRRKLATRFQTIVADAGGAQIWIKSPAKPRSGPGSEISLQALATPAAYRAVKSRLEQESRKEHLDLSSSASIGGGRLHVVNLGIKQRGQEIIQIHLREVPRLLRAAIVIDDLGRDLEAAHKLLALDYPLTFSVLPYLNNSEITAQEAHRSGHEVMLHLPMEPESSALVSPGKGAVLVGMNAVEVKSVVQDDLASVPYAAGVNNHMGSRATANVALMANVMKTLANHQLYFIDSRTTPASAALEAARHQGLPAFYRAVFLDDTQTIPYTLGQLRKFRHAVEQEGVALAIGHPNATTIAALAQFLPELERADIELVAPSQIVRLPELARLDPRPAEQNRSTHSRRTVNFSKPETGLR